MLKTRRRNNDNIKKKKTFSWWDSSLNAMNFFFLWDSSLNDQRVLDMARAVLERPQAQGRAGADCCCSAAAAAGNWAQTLRQRLQTAKNACAPQRWSSFPNRLQIFLNGHFPKTDKTFILKTFCPKQPPAVFAALRFMTFSGVFFRGIFHHQNPNQQQHRTLPAGFPHPGSNRHQRHSCFFQKQ